MVLNHTERRERRKKLAEFAGEEGVAEAAVQFRCSRTHVIAACEEFDVHPPKRTSGPPAHIHTFKILKALLDGIRQRELVKRYKVSRERISKIARNAREAGFEGGSL